MGVISQVGGNLVQVEHAGVTERTNRTGAPLGNVGCGGIPSHCFGPCDAQDPKQYYAYKCVTPSSLGQEEPCLQCVLISLG